MKFQWVDTFPGYIRSASVELNHSTDCKIALHINNKKKDCNPYLLWYEIILSESCWKIKNILGTSDKLGQEITQVTITK